MHTLTCVCGQKIVLAPHKPHFCECGMLYWVQNGKVEMREPHAVMPVAKGTC